MEERLTDHDRWLAAEYALGVLGRQDMATAEKRFDSDRAFRSCVEGWQNQLSPMLDDVDDVPPPASLWATIERQVAPVQTSGAREGGLGFWKLMTAFASTAAVGCFGLLMYVSGGDFSGRELKTLQAELQTVQQSNTALTAELDASKSETGALQSQLEQSASEFAQAQQALTETREALASAETEMTDLSSRLDANRQELASLRDQITQSQPLVASLTQSGDAPAFVAQYDPLKQALLIRTTISDTDEKVPEIWLIPEQGDRKGEVLSLGVMDEAAPDTVQISDDFLPLIGEGGTLAITMEPPGGAPNGVATGPVIALGKLQKL